MSADCRRFIFSTDANQYVILLLFLSLTFLHLMLQGSLSVVISLQPRLVKNEDEKRQDIKQLGTIIALLAKQCVIKKEDAERL